MLRPWRSEGKGQEEILPFGDYRCGLFSFVLFEGIVTTIPGSSHQKKGGGPEGPRGVQRGTLVRGKGK